MTIQEITSDEVEQCCENCGQTRRLKLADLTVGVTREEEPPDAKVVPLPKCENCGAAEFLFPSPEDEPDHPSPGSFGHLHRIMVDVLHSQLLIPPLQEVNQARLELVHLLDWYYIKVPLPGSIDNGHLMSNRNRLVLGLGQDRAHALAAPQLSARLLVQLGAKAGKDLELKKLGDIERQMA